MSDDLSKADNLQAKGGIAYPAGTHPDGVYFGMPDTEYHADPALGSSGIRDLMISPLRFWVKSVHNPDRPEEEETEAKDLGTYLHDLLLEGGTKNYIVKPEGMSFATKEGKAWRDMHDDFVIISQKQDATQRTMFKALELSGASKRFVGGQPEVSIFWTEKTGQRCKVRLDYLKPDEALDLKTYANSMDKDTETAVAQTIAARRISVQAFWYDRGLSVLVKMLAAHVGKIEKIAHTTDENRVAELLLLGELLGKFHEAGPVPLYFVFCETGAVPNITARRFVSHDDGELNAYWRWAKMGVQFATQEYARCMAKFGPGQIWIEEAYFKELTDDEMASARWVLANE